MDNYWLARVLLLVAFQGSLRHLSGLAADMQESTCSAGRCSFSSVPCDPGKRYFYYGQGVDGLGSQFFPKLTLKAFCAEDKNGCVYVHHPIQSAHHNYRGDSDFEVFAEKLLNMHHNVFLFSEMNVSCGLQSKYIMPRKSLFTPKILEDFRTGYAKGVGPPKKLISESDFNCVLYLRRGDMGPPSSSRLTNQEAIRIMKKVKVAFPNCTQYVFSQREWAHGTPDDDMTKSEESKSNYKPHKSRSVWIDADNKDVKSGKPREPALETFADIVASDTTARVIVDGDVWGVFDAMATADVLILDASMFPIVAAMFNANVVIANAIAPKRIAFPYGGYDKYILDHWRML